VTEPLQFLELSIPAADVQASLAWYCSIGFGELPVNDARLYRYAVVTNGELCIGLHGADIDSAGLTFVRRDLAQHVRARLAAGDTFEYVSLGIDAFHEARQRDADGSLAILLEARTFSPGQVSDRRRAPGRLLNIALPCLQVGEALDFWQGYGFIGVENAGSPAELHLPGLTLELAAGNRHLTLRFQPGNLAALSASLARDHSMRRCSDRARSGIELTAPEGTRIQLLEPEAV
jgi:hypothetical protein